MNGILFYETSLKPPLRPEDSMYATLTFLFQIGDLFEGKFNKRGLIQLIIFIVMGGIVIGFGVWMMINVVRTLKK